MRVSQKVKRATRKAILAAARRRFREVGFEATTTRDLAADAGIAAGTLFNYFPSKEALLVELAAEEFAAANRKQADAKAEGKTLDEDLFTLVAASLRKLRPLRKFLRPALATLTGPLVEDASAHAVREQHLGIVARLAEAHGLVEPAAVALQLYWTLISGVMAFWVDDGSPHQEDTWALLDASLQMFVQWLGRGDAEA